MLGVGLVGLLGNLGSIFVLYKEKNANLNMKAAYLHLFYDALSSVMVLITGTIIYFTGFLILDVIASFFIWVSYPSNT